MPWPLHGSLLKSQSFFPSFFPISFSALTSHFQFTKTKQKTLWKCFGFKISRNIKKVIEMNTHKRTRDERQRKNLSWKLLKRRGTLKCFKITFSLVEFIVVWKSKTPMENQCEEDDDEIFAKPRNHLFKWKKNE